RRASRSMAAQCLSRAAPMARNQMTWAWTRRPRRSPQTRAGTTTGTIRMTGTRSTARRR
ncbi:unnamed protein product, partial [Prorocentrum cordatum]